jgi:hypothetical protein
MKVIVTLLLLTIPLLGISQNISGLSSKDMLLNQTLENLTNYLEDKKKHQYNFKIDLPSDKKHQNYRELHLNHYYIKEKRDTVHFL